MSSHGLISDGDDKDMIAASNGDQSKMSVYSGGLCIQQVNNTQQLADANRENVGCEKGHGGFRHGKCIGDDSKLSSNDGHSGNGNVKRKSIATAIGECRNDEDNMAFLKNIIASPCKYKKLGQMITMKPSTASTQSYEKLNRDTMEIITGESREYGTLNNETKEPTRRSYTY